MDHRLHDRLSLSMARYLCERLAGQPELLQKVRDHLAYLETLELQCRAEYRQAWIDAVNSGVEAVIALATEESDWGQAIRSCSPLGPLWESPRERLTFITEWKKKHRPL